jgi:rubrerythrin
MPKSQSDEILESITMDNIDDAMYFYSHILEKIVEKKKKVVSQTLLKLDSSKKRSPP